MRSTMLPGSVCQYGAPIAKNATVQPGCHPYLRQSMVIAAAFGAWFRDS